MNMPDVPSLDRPNAIEVSNLAKTYPDNVQALNGLSLSVEQGTIYALLGPNGAGKTTMISILTTLALPSEGLACVNGMDVVRDPKKVRREIGVTFQEMVLDDALTGRQVLEYHGRLHGLSRADCAARSKKLLELVELSDAAGRKCKTYSGGMKRRLELSRALMTVPKVLFLDEPTLGLDPSGRSQIWNYIKGLMETSRLTVMLTTHYLDEAHQLADRVGIMDHGRLVVEGVPDQLIDELGADTVTIRGTGPNEALCDKLRSFEFVQMAAIVDDGVLLGLESSSRHLARIVSETADYGFAIEDVSVSKPDLGAVFFKYTGHELQNGERL
jgi:ABC-2 type transport system ATP-binding protein